MNDQTALAVKWLWISVVVCCLLVVANGLFDSFNIGVSYAITAVLVCMLARPLAHGLASWKQPVSKVVSVLILVLYLLLLILVIGMKIINRGRADAYYKELNKVKQEHNMGTEN